MTTFVLHFCWFIFFLFFSLFFLMLAIVVSSSSVSLNLSLDLFSSWFMKLSLNLSLDLFSSWFSFVVSLISCVIMLYSYFYMAPYSKPTYFIWLTVLFVLSMLVVINFSSIVHVMLGWDGLGLISFFLIVYYQNNSSISSGLFTLLMNRIGDCFFIISISLFFLNLPFYWDSYSSVKFFILIMMVLTFITKSAIYPFSPWLPLAMAAPTPISALVHSSTLVTAGLYLCIRFNFMLYSSQVVMLLLLTLSVFTSFYAGMNSVFETDLKKMIALSTLSHLGFIGMAFSCGLLNLAFFHLLTHALFKSVLFMAMGEVMTNLFHAQDSRYLSGGSNLSVSSSFTMMVSLLNLLGLPSLSGFVSKDLVLETLNFSVSSFFLVYLIYLNVIFTYYYTYRLLMFLFKPVSLASYLMVHSINSYHSLALLLITTVSVFFGYFWMNFLTTGMIHIMVPLMAKIYPLVLNLFMFIYLLFFLSFIIPSSSSYQFFFSNMMFLSNVMMSLSSNFFIKFSFLSIKSSESGIYDNIMNSSLYTMAGVISSNLFKLFNLSSMLTFMFFSFFFIVMYLF